MNKPFELHIEAYIDFLEAGIYTVDNFDEKQWNIYKELLKSSIQELANSDQDITPDYYVYSKGVMPFILVGKRKIFFIRTNGLLIVRRIQHYRADITPDLFESDDNQTIPTLNW